MNTLWVIGGDSGIGAACLEQATTTLSVGLAYDRVVGYGSMEMDVRSMYDVHDRVEHDGNTRGWPTDIIYSAGVNSLAMIGELQSNKVHDQFSVNALGLIWLADALKNLLPEGHRLNIVAICSNAAETPMRGSIAYCASKAAEVMAVRCIAREMAPLWRINGVSPSTVDGTPMTDYIDATVPALRGWTREEARAYEMKGNPMGRRATVSETVDLIFNVLRGPEFMTGSIIKLTGGM